MEPNALPDVPESVLIGDEKLNVFVEGRRPRCFECGEVGHIRKACKKVVAEEANKKTGEKAEVVVAAAETQEKADQKKEEEEQKLRWQ